MNYFIFRKWISIKNKLPIPYTNIFLLFDDGTIEIGQYWTNSSMAIHYQPFGTEDRGIYTGSAKVIKWAKL